jgi:hypothetical protein
MIELGKSMASFSWAMSVYSVNQVTRLATSTDQEKCQKEVRASFDRFTDQAEDQLTNFFRRSFQAGDELQRGMFDAAYGFLTFNPGRVLKSTSTALQRSAEALRQATADVVRHDGDPCGWPPMGAFE